MNDFELTIRVSADGKIGVKGPIDQKMICLGALELAKQAILKFSPNSDEVPHVLLARSMPPINGAA